MFIILCKSWLRDWFKEIMSAYRGRDDHPPHHSLPSGHTVTLCRCYSPGTVLINIISTKLGLRAVDLWIFLHLLDPMWQLQVLRGHEQSADGRKAGQEDEHVWRKEQIFLAVLRKIPSKEPWEDQYLLLCWFHVAGSCMAVPQLACRCVNKTLMHS